MKIISNQQNCLNPPDISKSKPITVPNGEIGRLVAAAVVDEDFRKMLLTNPAAALESSYGGETFHLSDEEKDLVMSVKEPKSLPDFASQLAKNYQKN